MGRGLLEKAAVFFNSSCFLRNRRFPLHFLRGKRWVALLCFSHLPLLRGRGVNCLMWENGRRAQCLAPTISLLLPQSTPDTLLLRLTIQSNLCPSEWGGPLLVWLSQEFCATVTSPFHHTCQALFSSHFYKQEKGWFSLHLSDSFVSVLNFLSSPFPPLQKWE